ncbi:MAG: ATP-binding protein [Magnetococcus sp. WYHC-3]
MAPLGRDANLLVARYRTLLVWGSMLLILTMVAVSGFEFYNQRHHELRFVEEFLQNRAHQVDALLRGATAPLSDLRLLAKENLQGQVNLSAAPLMAYLNYRDTGEWNRILDPERPLHLGSLFGDRESEGRPPSYFKALNALLHVLPLQRVAVRASRHLTRVVVATPQGLMTVYPPLPTESPPGVQSSGELMAQQVMSSEWFTRAQSSQESMFWVVPDGDMREVIHCQVIRSENRFLGVVASWLDVSTLLPPLYGPAHPEAWMLLADDRYRVILAPGLTRNAPAELNLMGATGVNLDAGDLQVLYGDAGGWMDKWPVVFLSAPLEVTGWKLIYMVPQLALAAKIAPTFLSNAGIVLALLIGQFMLFRMVERSFVVPALGLIRHIDLEARGEPSDLPDSAPVLWRLWFTRVSESFQANRALLKRVRRDSEELNLLVDDRTRELRQQITERHRAMRELRAAKEEAETANRAKSEFLANMSHELRTPLHAILGFSSMGLERCTSSGVVDRIPRYFTRIQESGARLLDLLNDLLDLSKLEAGRMSFSPAPGDLLTVVEATLSELDPLLTAKRQVVTVEPPGFSTRMELDSGRIMQVLRNLLANAHKFTPEGRSIRIRFLPDRVGLVSDPPADNIVAEPVVGITVLVEDQGMGIPEHELESIFDKFVQSSKTKTGAGGTGLGLAICRQILQAHGGEILARNNVEGGATFAFYLPRVSVVPSEAKAAPEQAQKEKGTGASLEMPTSRQEGPG